MENCYHLARWIVGVTTADGHAERATAQQIVAALGEEQPKIMIIGADKGYATKGFVRIMRWLGVMPHVTQNTKRPGDSAIDGRTTRHRFYKKSIDARPGIEKVFGWIIKEMDGQQQLKHRGRSTVGAVFSMNVITYKLACLRNLLKPRGAVA